MVDDLKVATTCEFFKFHESEIRLDPRGVTVHHQTDGSGGSDDRGLSIAVAVLFSKTQGLVPRFLSSGDEFTIHKLRIQRLRQHSQAFKICFGINRAAVITDHTQHVFTVVLKARKGALLFCNQG